MQTENQSASFMSSQTFRNVIVTGYSDLLDSPSGGYDHRGGPVWPDFTRAGPERFWRRNKVADVLPEVPDNVMAPLNRGDWFWLGPQVPHFGHAVADFSTRYLSSRALSNKKTRFILGDRATSQSPTISPITRQILEWFDIPVDSVEVVTAATTFRSLRVTPQAQQHNGCPPSEEYLDALTGIQNSKIIDSSGVFSDRVYVSRSLMPTHLAGELYIDNIFQRAGFHVVHPQLLTVFEQLQIYMHAEHIVLASGSAMHGLELLGSLGCKVSVITRRPGTRIGETALRPRVAELNYHEGAEQLLFGARKNGTPALEQGIGVPHPKHLKETLTQIIGSSLEEFEERELISQMRLDLSKWMETQEARELFQTSEYQAVLADSLTTYPEILKYLPHCLS